MTHDHRRRQDPIGACASPPAVVRPADTRAADIPAAVPEDAEEEESAPPREGRRAFRAWQEYYEQRQRVCYRVRRGRSRVSRAGESDVGRGQHARVLEGMLAEDPGNKLWLETHGFSVDTLVRYLRWNPAEQLRQLEHMDPVRRAKYAKQLHAEHRRNLRRMEENLTKVLPVRASELCVRTVVNLGEAI